MELSYSLHLGNDKNKSIKARKEAKNLQLYVLFSIYGCYLYFYFNFDLMLSIIF